MKSLKKGKEMLHFEDITHISINKYLDEESLYTPRQPRKSMEVELIIEPHLDENVRAEALAKMKLNARYTKISIEKIS